MKPYFVPLIPSRSRRVLFDEHLEEAHVVAVDGKSQRSHFYSHFYSPQASTLIFRYGLLIRQAGHKPGMFREGVLTPVKVSFARAGRRHLELLGVCLSFKMMQSLLSFRPRPAWSPRPSAAEPACGEQHGGRHDCPPETGVPVSGGANQLTNTRL